VHSERAILDVLFPKVRAQLLRLLFALPQKQRYVRELANMSGLALCTIQDELRRLTAVGLLITWSNGYHRFYRANKNHPLFPQLIRLVQISARLPQTKHSALNRQPASGKQGRRRRRRVDPLPPDRPIKWDLFSRNETRLL
jgi:predicted transcriptional regulator